MHMAISGRLGSGKSTVCAILNEKYGFEIYSTGKIQRRIAQNMGISTLELNKRMSLDNKLDHEIDYTVADISRQKSSECIIFDSRMAWHFAENAFKIYVYVDPNVAALRVMNDNRGSEEKYANADDARAKLAARSNEENRRYKEIYGVDNFDYRNYDLIIDSTYAAPEIIAETILNAYKTFSRGTDAGTKMMLSPNALYPTGFGQNSADVTALPCNGFHYIVSGSDKVLAAASEKQIFIEASVADAKYEGELQSMIKKAGVASLREFEQAGNFKYISVPELYCTD